MKNSRQARPAARTVSETLSPLRYTVTPGIHTPIAVKVLPDAPCTLHAEDDDDPHRTLKAYADSDGIVRYHVMPLGESGRLDRLVIDCPRGKEIVRHPLHLRSSFEPTSDIPPPPKEHRLKHRPGARVRPPLSLEDALHLTNKELLPRGYPLRPDPEAAPDAFGAWFRAVSRPATLIEPHVISNPDVTHDTAKRAGPATSTNWSGFELLQSRVVLTGEENIGDPYDWVTGTWVVPAVTGAVNQKTYSTLWVGLDGDGTPDLLQAGTEQDNLTTGNVSVSTYYFWTELLPQQTSEQVINGFTVNPGDEVLINVWVGTGNDAPPSLSGTQGRFFIMNLRTGGFAQMGVDLGTTVVGGSRAVWIMERPTLAGGTLPNLANYGSVVLYDASARRANSGRNEPYIGETTLQFTGPRTKQMTMVNGRGTLSTVTAIDANSMRFDVAFS
jgi:hypothetical protein